MSATQHEAAAQDEARQATEHEAQYDPQATQVVDRCRGDAVCWSSMVNPTDEHRRDAEEHRARAAQHRKASQALLAAEQTSCVGISDDDRDMSPFRHREDILSVSKLEREEPHGKLKHAHLAGATVVFRAVKGMTEQWLQRVIDCHIARNQAVGQDVDMPYCPLTVKGVAAEVRPLADGFAVDISANDESSATQVLERAEHLTGR